MLHYIRKLSRSFGRWRYLRIAVFVVLFFMIMSVMGANLLFSTKLNPQNLATDPCRFDVDELPSKNSVPYRFSGEEMYFDSALPFNANIEFSDGFKVFFPVFTITGINQNITRFGDFQLIKGSVEKNGVYVSQTLWKKIKRDYPMVNVGAHIKLNFTVKNGSVRATHEYTIAGVIRDRWVHYYYAHIREELLVPLSFFASLPEKISYEGVNETLYGKSYAIEEYKKYVPLLAGTEYGMSYYAMHRAIMREYNSFLFVASSFILVLLVLGGGISLITAMVNNKKYALDFGILRVSGVPLYKIIALFAGENIYTMVIAYFIALIFSYVFLLGILLVSAGVVPVYALINFFLVPLLLILVMTGPTVAYTAYHMKTKEIVEHLRNA